LPERAAAATTCGGEGQHGARPAGRGRRSRVSARKPAVIGASLSAIGSSPRCPRGGTVTLIEKSSGALEFEAVATEHRWVVHISGGSVGRGDLTPDREAVDHLGSAFRRAEQMPSRPEVCGDAAEGGQEPLRMPRRFEAFHRPFALSGG